MRTNFIELKDDYYWMLDPTKSDPEVIKYINAENEYTEQVLKHTETLQEKLFKELISSDSKPLSLLLICFSEIL